MSDLSSLFWNANIEEIKKGYVYERQTESFVCLVCGARYQEGEVVPIEGKFWEARRAMQKHIQTEHTSMFHYLVGLDKKYTGLTEHQIRLMNYFYQGWSDREILEEIGGSASTIRNYRFTFKEKEKQAKITLAILELLREPKPAVAENDATNDKEFIEIHRTAKMVDDRFAITQVEFDKIIRSYFKEGPEGPLSSFPTKEKRRVAVLKHLMQRFAPDRKYSEKEVNEIIKAAYHDYVTLRRNLIEYGFMDREADGSVYWVKA